MDAIVPIIGWHSLETSLFKGRVIKEGWARLLTGVSGTESVNPDRHRVLPQRGLETGGVTDDDPGRGSSVPRARVTSSDRITVPTLIIQGTVDTLFTLDEGVTNFAILRGNDVPVAMVWFCGGHGVCYTDPGQEGRVSDAAIAWLRRYVAEEDVELGPAVDLLDQNGVSWTSDEFPEPTGDPVTASGSGTLQLTAGGGAGPSTAEPSAPDVVTGLAGSIMPGKATNAVDVPITFDRDALVVGAPTLELTYTGTVPAGERPTAVFAQLVDDATGLVLGNQVTPVPLVLDGAEHTATVPVGGGGLRRGRGGRRDAAAGGDHRGLRRAPPGWPGRLPHHRHLTAHGGGHDGHGADAADVHRSRSTHSGPVAPAAGWGSPWRMGEVLARCQVMVRAFGVQAADTFPTRYTSTNTGRWGQSPGRGATNETASPTRDRSWSCSSGLRRLSWRLPRHQRARTRRSSMNCSGRKIVTVASVATSLSTSSKCSRTNLSSEMMSGKRSQRCRPVVVTA